jgi:type III secretion protein U
VSEKTEKPTPRRLKKARDDGQLPKSRLLSAGLPTLGATAGAASWTHQTARTLEAWAQSALAGTSTPSVLVERGLTLLASLAAPVLAGGMVGALAAGLLQAGLRFDFGLLAPKTERMDWGAGLKRVVTLKALPDAARPALAAALALAVGGSAVHAAVARSTTSLGVDGSVGFLRALAPATATIQALAALVGAFALADLLLARWLHLRGLRMSRNEVKQEYKSQEGDPQHKSKRKALHRQLANAGPARSVAQATVVVVNPTHIAVALRYAPGECAAPYVVARGREDEAHEIRKAARLMKVPIVKDVPLARALVHCEPGDEVPEELFVAAAAILKTVLPPSIPGATP